MAVTTKRLNWLKWLYPGEAGLQSEQSWHIDKRRNHMKDDHVPGVVSGLEVLETSGTPDLEVHVQVGRAIGGDGEEIVLEGIEDVDLSFYASGGATVKIVAEYAEQGTDPYIVPETAVSQDKFLQDDPTITTITGAPAANQIVLAQVVVTNGATQITDAVDPENPGTNEIDMTVTEYSTLSRSASEKVEGVVELATTAEAQAGTDDLRVITPKKLHEGVPLPTNHIGGLITSNNGSDAEHDIDISKGQCRDVGDTANMVLSAVLTKRIDALWVVGNGSDGLDAGAVAAGTLYAVWLIKRSDTGVVDAIFSTSFSTPNPTRIPDYDLKRLIGAVCTDGSANIFAYIQSGDYFHYMDGYIEDVNNPSMGNVTFVVAAMSVPPLCLAHITGWMTNPTSTSISDGYLWIRTEGEPNNTIQAEAFHAQRVQIGDFGQLGSTGFVLVDASRQIKYACTELTGAATVIIETIGFNMLTRREP